MTDMAPAAVAKAPRGGKMQALADRQSHGSTARGPARAGGLAVLRRAVRKAEYALDDEQVKRTSSSTGCCTTACSRAGSSTACPSRSDTISPSTTRRARLRGLRRGRQIARPLYADYFKRDNKSGGAWMASYVDQAGSSTRTQSCSTCATSRSPQRASRAPHVRQRADDVPRVRPRAARLLSNVKYRPSPAPTCLAISSSSLPVQRALGLGAHGLRELREALQDRRADAGGARVEDRQVAEVQPGYATTEYLAAALLDMAWHTLPEGAPKQEVDAFEAEALKRFKVDFPLVPPATGRATSRTSGRRLLGQLLRVPVERGARRRRVPVVRRARRDDAAERAAVPRDDPFARQHRDMARSTARSAARTERGALLEQRGLAAPKAGRNDQALVSILMGSKSDLDVMQPARDALTELGVEHEVAFCPRIAPRMRSSPT